MKHVPGTVLIIAQGLLNRTRYPSDEQIREALADNLCRCGVYNRVRRAIKLRVGRPDARPTYDVARMETETAVSRHLSLYALPWHVSRGVLLEVKRVPLPGNAAKHGSSRCLEPFSVSSPPRKRLDFLLHLFSLPFHCPPVCSKA